MPVCRINGKTVLFIHIPKCGGSSVEELMRSHAAGPVGYIDTGKGAFFNGLRKCSPQHMHAAQLREIFRLDAFDLIFTVCRDPVARIKSEFHMRMNSPLASGGFDQWYAKVRELRVRNPYVLDNHLRPQAEFLVQGALVYRLEDGLDSIWADVARRLGAVERSDTVPSIKPLPRSVPRRHTVEEPSARTVRLITSDYAVDYSLLRGESGIEFVRPTRLPAGHQGAL